MDAREFLLIAERFRNSGVEAERRTSAGRSYYALFNVVVSTLAGNGVPFSETYDDHRRLISNLTNAGSTTAASVGRLLKELRTDRNRADYRLDEMFESITSELVYSRAIKALRQFDSIPAAELASIVKRIQALK
jgi:hypothetical protein